MIELKTRVHDRYSIEFKMGFISDGRPDDSDFTVGMWIFAPGSLDITPTTFTNADFYRCLKSNVRLITPHFPLYGIIGHEAVPFSNVKNAATEDYEYQLKLFCAIAKSAIRDEAAAISAIPEKERGERCARYASEIEAILRAVDGLPEADCKRYCSEFLCNMASAYSFPLLEDRCCRKELTQLLRFIGRFRQERGFACVREGDDKANSLFVHRRGVLKKYVESPMYLRVPKKRDGVVREQAAFSLAAGLAMIFATIVAWAFQRRFGNLTWPLFIALIISYMLKDRIKELMRFFFAHRIGSRHYDKKAEISIRDHRIGTIKEAVNFIQLSKVPQEVEHIRNRIHLCPAEDRFTDEKVILYKKAVRLDDRELQKFSTYRMSGINDIIRLQVRPFLRNMDNPEVEVNALDERGEVVRFDCPKDYFINIILQYSYGGTTEYKRFRLALNRDGIRSLEEVL